MKQIGAITATIIVGTLCSFYSAFVLMKLWSWLIVPQFEVQPISFYKSLCVLLIWEFIIFPITRRLNNIQEKKETGNALIELFVMTLAIGTISLLVGFVFSLFM